MLEKERHVLVILPHPDDESFGCSLTLSKYRELGVPVTYVCWTLGEMGRNFGNPPFANRETLPSIRKEELMNACRAMNVEDVRLGGLRDKTLEFEDDEEMTQKVAAYIDELQPSVIYSFYPGFSVHPDHEASARAVIRAVRALPEDERPKLHLIAFANDTVEHIGEPNIHHYLPEMAKHKQAALEAHASQTALVLGNLKDGIKKGMPDATAYFENEYFYTYNWSNDTVE